MNKYSIEIDMEDQVFDLTKSLEEHGGQRVYIKDCNVEVRKHEDGDWYKIEDVDKLKSLFNKYLNHIISCEGSDFLENHDYDPKYRLTDEEIKDIEEIKSIQPFE